MDSVLKHDDLKPEDLDLRISIHYGIPATSSILAFDSVQRLLAVGTLDGRIKVIGGDNIEGLLISSKQLPYKFLEFIQNHGFLVGISNDDDIQIWNLEKRGLSCCLQWESNITAFSIVTGSKFMYIGDSNGFTSVLKFDTESGKLLQLPYIISGDSLSELAGFPLPDHQPVVGILPQPCSAGNRVIIAYENGLIILWDSSEAQIHFVGGGKDLQLKDVEDNDTYNGSDGHDIQDKEISALCWASSDGSILAVGYLDGDILFWNTSIAAASNGKPNGSSKNVVKLQLSSAEKRIPVIVLQWSPNDKSYNNSNGRLFLYGGEEIGADEVLTVLSLEWSNGTEALSCVGRLDLTLVGSFADMVLLPSAGATGGNHKADLFVLTSPGQLHSCDDSNLSTWLAQQERKQSVCTTAFPLTIPTSEPLMTVAKFCNLSACQISSKGVSEAPVIKTALTPAFAGGKHWPLTGGILSRLSVSKNNSIERVYMAGYRDGSVRIWDASYPVLRLICLIEGQLKGMDVAGSSAPVSTLNFCSRTLCLAVGNECGLVRVFNLNESACKPNFHYVTETNSEVRSLPRGEGPHFIAAISLISSPVQALHFRNSGTRLAIGFKCGGVALFDMNSSSILFFTDCVLGASSPVISMSWVEFANARSPLKSTKHAETKVPENTEEEIVFILTKDMKISCLNGRSGSTISSHPWHLKKEDAAISMYVLDNRIPLAALTSGKHPDESSKDIAPKKELKVDGSTVGADSKDTNHPNSLETACSGEQSQDALVLLCCQKSLRLYSMKAVIQGNGKAIRKVKHAKPCCWTTTLKKDGNVCGLVLFFQTGVFEIRSLPDLELLKESSILSILRWNLKPNMEKTMSSDDAQITLANGSEVAFISLLAGKDDFRIPESLPCLHDGILAAAAEAAISFSANQNKKQGSASGILSGMVKGLKAGKVTFTTTPQSDLSHLEAIFLKPPPFSHAFSSVARSQEEVEEELSIDDIEIDEIPPVASSSHEAVNPKQEKETDREKLLGKPDDTKPRLRTPEEIMAKYRKATDASAAAAQARNKLLQRQEKLERINRRTEELASGAEDFASLANELVKTMENRKWWHI